MIVRKRWALLFLACLLLTGCFSERLVGLFQGERSLVKVCYPSEKLLREAQTKYADHTPLTADDLRHLLHDDTMHYKIAIVYSYCCAPCKEAMPTVYAPLYKALDTSRCRMYFILDDCGSLPWNSDYLNHYDIPTRYYLRDADSLFLWRMEDGKLSNNQNWTNIVNYALLPSRAFTDCDYAPLTLIVSPDGRVKQVFERYNDYEHIVPYDLRDMVRDSLTIFDLDFDRIDTVSYNVDYGPDRDAPDTVSFRSHRPNRYCTPDGKCY